MIPGGASLIQNAADVVEAIHLPANNVRSIETHYEPAPEMNGDDALGAVEELLRPSPVPVDEFIRL